MEKVIMVYGIGVSWLPVKFVLYAQTFFWVPLVPAGTVIPLPPPPTSGSPPRANNPAPPQHAIMVHGHMLVEGTKLVMMLALLLVNLLETTVIPVFPHPPLHPPQ